jgi:hypothetical protein
MQIAAYSYYPPRMNLTGMKELTGMKAAFSPAGAVGGAFSGSGGVEARAGLKDLKAMPLHRPYLNTVKFGFIACGVCPICLAGLEAQRQLNTIKNLRENADAATDTLVKAGSGAAEIRAVGTLAGGEVNRKYIGNEDGTRVQRLDMADYPAFVTAALPRDYPPTEPGYTASDYKIVGNPAHPLKGIDNGLYKHLLGGLRQAKEGTESFTEEATPSVQEALLDRLGEKPQAFGVYHHIADGNLVKNNGDRTIPLLIGYASVAQPRPRELFVPSIREMPGFESLGAAPGGLMNLLAMATQHGGFDSVQVLVEPWQQELKDYIVGALKNEYHFPVEEFPLGKMPIGYRDFIHDLNLPTGSCLYKIPLDTLKAARKNLPSPAEEPDKGKRDTALMETIKLPDPNKDLMEKKFRDALKRLPRYSDITLFNHDADPDYEKWLKDRPVPVGYAAASA